MGGRDYRTWSSLRAELAAAIRRAMSSSNSGPAELDVFVAGDDDNTPASESDARIATITSDINKIVALPAVASSLSQFLAENLEGTQPKYHKCCATMMERIDGAIEGESGRVGAAPLSMAWLAKRCWVEVRGVVSDSWVLLAAKVELLIHTYGTSTSPISGPVVSLSSAEMILMLRSQYFVHLFYSMVNDKKDIHFCKSDFNGNKPMQHGPAWLKAVDKLRSSAVISTLAKLERCENQNAESRTCLDGLSYITSASRVLLVFANVLL